MKWDFRIKEISAGSFLMGSRGYEGYEESIHRVQISRPFYLGTFHVTQKLFAIWTDQSGIEHENSFADNPQHPAENINWHKATAYCNWLTVHYAENFPAGYIALKHLLKFYGLGVNNLKDAQTGLVLRTFKGHKDSLSGALATPDNWSIISGAGDAMLRIKYHC